MASDVLVDISDRSDRPNSPDPSDDNDAVNTSSARIYFGPFQSAEKKFARVHDAAEHMSVRRSQRLSAMPLPDSMQDSSEEDEEKGPMDASVAADSPDHSRPGTPIIGDDVLEGAYEIHLSLMFIEVASD